MDYDALRYAHQSLLEVVQTLEDNNLPFLAEQVEDIAAELADQIVMEDLDLAEEEERIAA